jgi:NAD(P)-dependent dehydrogenase (short-subunit alcohol dehydrogenase family)
MPESNAIAVVTGASRGAGKGIAIALGSHGCTVYVTGRSQKTGDAPLPGTIVETAAAVSAAGGKGIPVCVDHADDNQVKALFNQVEEEQGKLDILVNNAFAVHDQMASPGKFWEKPLSLVDMWDVGLRGTYVCCYHAAPLLKAGGLMAFTSAPGARHYVFGPTYGVHKAGLDKMAADMAVDFRDQGVTCVSIWMGALLTERMAAMIAEAPDKYGHLDPGSMESPEFTGHIIWAIYNDPGKIRLSGKAVIGAETALDYAIADRDGIQPPSYRERHGVYPAEQHPYEIH